MLCLETCLWNQVPWFCSNCNWCSQKNKFTRCLLFMICKVLLWIPVVSDITSIHIAWTIALQLCLFCQPKVCHWSKSGASWPKDEHGLGRDIMGPQRYVNLMPGDARSASQIIDCGATSHLPSFMLCFSLQHTVRENIIKNMCIYIY